MLIERKVKDTESKMKGGTERQLKMVEGEQNQGKPGDIKPKIRQWDN
jgi:hypothetical protein